MISQLNTSLHGVVHEIVTERLRQIGDEGYSLEHDDGETEGELARAAAAYAIHFRHSQGRLYPWSDGWKPGDHRRNCVKAAAMLIAEIERLDRLDARRKLAELRK